MRRVQAGDSGAFAMIYDRYAPLVFGLAKRMLGNSAAAEDVAQSVFLALWSRPSAFAGGNFAGWIATVTRNASIDVLRSAAVRTREPELSPNIASNDDIDEEVFERVRAGQVAGALQNLPEDQRVAIERAYFEGLTYREVAEKLGAPLGTVKSRIRAGLRTLSDSLRGARTL
jgi:RNA polymerase sigma-70 factor (ECF subfamily)